MRELGVLRCLEKYFVLNIMGGLIDTMKPFSSEGSESTAIFGGDSWIQIYHSIRYGIGKKERDLYLTK
jgi:hypothetical protein